MSCQILHGSLTESERFKRRVSPAYFDLLQESALSLANPNGFPIISRFETDVFHLGWCAIFPTYITVLRLPKPVSQTGRAFWSFIKATPTSCDTFE